MTECVFTVGIPASGKTYWANHQSGFQVIDSDSIREELWGNACDQQNPTKVFETMFKKTCNMLQAGNSVIYCATNISFKHRVNTLTRLKKKFPKTFFRCVIFNTPVDICKEMNRSRARQVPEWVFERQIRSFQIPVYNEGWDSIEIYTPFNYNTEEFCQKIWIKVNNFGSQDNPHHSLTLKEHLIASVRFVNLSHIDSTRCNNTIWNSQTAVIDALIVHDIGKIYTKTFDDEGIAHYYNHAEVGAYICMNMGFPREIIELVNYHMCPYMNEKAQSTWQNRLGNTLWTKLIVVHNADVAAH